MNATPLPVSIALAGHISTCCLRNVIATSSTAHVSSEIRICAIETRKWNAVWPSTCSVVITAARCSRGSLSFGSSTGYGVPRIVSVRPAGAGAAGALIARPCVVPHRAELRVVAECACMKLRARARDRRLRRLGGLRRRCRSSSPTRHGELVAAATMDGAAPDTRLNAQRKAYTAARSDARSTRELAEKVRDDPVERASFDPFFTFFLGGVAVVRRRRRGSAPSGSAASPARSTSSSRSARSKRGPRRLELDALAARRPTRAAPRARAPGRPRPRGRAAARASPRIASLTFSSSSR